MNNKILDYRIIVEKEKTGNKNKFVYNAYCPVLGLADFGDTIDKALARVQSLIKFHLESLVKEGRRVPIEKEITMVITSVKVSSPSDFRFSYV